MLIGNQKIRDMNNYEKTQGIYSSLLSNKDLNAKDKEKIYKKYLDEIRELANSGNGNAQFDLALHYEEYNFFGLNPDYNPEKVFHWAHKACNNDIAEACNNLGTYYESGIGCEKDLKEAVLYYKRAISLGSEPAKENLTLLDPAGTPPAEG